MLFSAGYTVKMYYVKYPYNLIVGRPISVGMYVIKNRELLAALASLALVLVGCSTTAGTPRSDFTTATATSTLGPGFVLVTATPQRIPTPRIQPPPAITPLCRINIDLEQQFLLYTTTLYLRPPFYEGPVPLEFESVKKPGIGGIGMGLGSRTIIHAFDEWTTIYEYADPSFEVSGIATCAQTFSKSRKLLAEARFEEIVEGMGIIILEVHYNEDGSVRFWCKSQIEFGTDFKTREMDAYGTKREDYYFIWPVSSH
jgi:hypothetical protein